MIHLLSAKMLLSVVIGGVGGFAWYKIVGCSTGSCPITSNPYISIIYGMLMGGVLAA